MILLKQHDQKRRCRSAAGEYLPGHPGRAPAGRSAARGKPAAPKPPGVVIRGDSIVDIGERKDASARGAPRKTMVDRQPQPGACDQSKMRIETDAWYIDVPKAMATPPDGGAARPARRVRR